MLPSNFCGEDLISFFSSFIVLGSNTTKVPELISTTPDYGQVKRKGSTWENDKRKHLLKRPRTTSCGEDQQQFKCNDGNYGFVLDYNGVANEIVSENGNSTSFIKFLENMLAGVSVPVNIYEECRF